MASKSKVLKETKIETHLPHVPGNSSWVAERGVLKWFLYVHKTNKFHLFTTREARRRLERKLRNAKNKLDGVRRGRFKKPLVFWGGPFFINK